MTWTGARTMTRGARAASGPAGGIPTLRGVPPLGAEVRSAGIPRGPSVRTDPPLLVRHAHGSSPAEPRGERVRPALCAGAPLGRVQPC
jgi:hypothetical protein